MDERSERLELVGKLAASMVRLSCIFEQLLFQTLQIAKHPYIDDHFLLEGEQSTTRPSHSLLRGTIAHKIVSVNTGEGHFGKYLVSLGYQFFNNTVVITQRLMHHIDVCSETCVSAFLLAQRASKGNARIE